MTVRSAPAPRRLGVVLAGAVVGCGLLAGSQAVASPLDPFVLATAHAGHAVSAIVDFGASPLGPTSHELVVGLPGSTDEIDDDAQLPPTAILRQANQVDAAQTAGPTSLAARFTPDRAGDYPVFVFASGEMGCATANMVDETIGFTITQVGLVRVR
ncbi:MAG: hypothetical protein ABJB98_05105 [Actinomycetota bacterium]